MLDVFFPTFTSEVNPYTGLTVPANVNRTFQAVWCDWTATPPVPAIDQFRVSGGDGDDDIEFIDQATAYMEPLDVSPLTARSTDYVAVIDGGPGNDILRGPNGRDSIDGGGGNDIIYGGEGDNELWGAAPGEGSVTDHDVIYGGQGNDDEIGGPGTNDLYAWSMDPQMAIDELHFTTGQTATADSTGLATLTSASLYATYTINGIADQPLPSDGILPNDATFSVAAGRGAHHGHPAGLSDPSEHHNRPVVDSNC